ncbi:hypothetical protein BSLG_008865 [Batrachochytrium salamandrivorans]|nr:hypothetical protein BSLG_008865 [Batrachochytrium salamandrivorans]
MSAAIATPEFKAIVKVIKQHQQGHISKLQLKSEAELELLEALREYMQILGQARKTFQARRFRKYLGPSIVPLAAPMQASAGTPSTPSSSTLPSQIEMCETDLSPSIRDSNTSITAEADLAQKKYEDAAKRPKSGLQALKNLVTGKDAEERIIKLKSKWKTRARQLNNSRNQYLLSLQGINAMQSHYYKAKIGYQKCHSPYQSPAIRINVQIQTLKELGDEVSIFLGDAIEIVSPDTDGRTKVESTIVFVLFVMALLINQHAICEYRFELASNTTGFVPTANISIKSSESSAQLLTDSSLAGMVVYALEDYEATDEGELCFKTGDAIECTDGIFEDEEWWDGRVLRTNQTGTFQVKLTKGWETVAATTASKESLCDAPVPALYSYEATCDGELSIDAGEILLIKSKETGSDAWWEVHALYDFVPTSPEELAFKSGDVITVTQSTDPDWWDGELNGLTGAFPASYVTSNVSDI